MFGPFNGIMYKEKEAFLKHLFNNIIRYEDRVKRRFIPMEFRSPALGDALFDCSMQYLDREYSNLFSFIKIVDEGGITYYNLSIKMDNKWEEVVFSGRLFKGYERFSSKEKT